MAGLTTTASTLQVAATYAPPIDCILGLNESFRNTAELLPASLQHSDAAVRTQTLKKQKSFLIINFQFKNLFFIARFCNYIINTRCDIGASGVFQCQVLAIYSHWHLSISNFFYYLAYSVINFYINIGVLGYCIRDTYCLFSRSWVWKNNNIKSVSIYVYYTNIYRRNYDGATIIKIYRYYTSRIIILLIIVNRERTNYSC